MLDLLAKQSSQEAQSLSSERESKLSCLVPSPHPLLFIEVVPKIPNLRGHPDFGPILLIDPNSGSTSGSPRASGCCVMMLDGCRIKVLQTLSLGNQQGSSVAGTDSVSPSQLHTKNTGKRLPQAGRALASFPTLALRAVGPCLV